MTNEFARILALVDAYLKDANYMALWSPIAGPGAVDRDPGPFAPDEESLWDDLYEIVYMGQQDSASPGERADGLLGGPELQARLREWREATLRALAV